MNDTNNNGQNVENENKIGGEQMNLEKNQENNNQIKIEKDQNQNIQNTFTSNRSGQGTGQGQTQYNNYNQNTQNYSQNGSNTNGQSQPNYNNYQQNYNNQNKKSSAPIIIVIIIIAVLLLCCLPTGIISYLAVSSANKQGAKIEDYLSNLDVSIDTDDDYDSAHISIKTNNNASEDIKNTKESINKAINSISDTVNEVNNIANSITDSVNNTNTTNTTSSDSKTTNNTTTTTNTTKSVVIDAKESSKEKPIKAGTWGIASKYNSDTTKQEKVYVKATKTIRGEDAKAAVKDYTDKSSFYKYTEPNEGLEWVVVDYEMNFSDFNIPKNGVEPRLSVSITGTGNNSAVKYNGVTYFMIMATNIGSSSYVKEANAQGRVAFQMPIGCSDYIMKFGDSSGNIAFIKGE